jgi:hypothetical protein
MKLWKWQNGRQQDTKYQKLPLWYFRIGRFGFDAYILKYAPNTVLEWHTDPVPNGEHWRRNFTLKGWSAFGMRVNNVTRFYCMTGTPLFRPDLCEHMLRTYNKECIKLSLGFVKFN